MKQSKFLHFRRQPFWEKNPIWPTLTTKKVRHFCLPCKPLFYLKASSNAGNVKNVAFFSCYTFLSRSRLFWTTNMESTAAVSMPNPLICIQMNHNPKLNLTYYWYVDKWGLIARNIPENWIFQSILLTHVKNITQPLPWLWFGHLIQILWPQKHHIRHQNH